MSESRSALVLAEEWIRWWSLDERDRAGEQPDLDTGLTEEPPERYLDAILEVLARVDHSSPSPMLGVLAAGPLENLLNQHGEAVIERVEILARRDPGFRLLLNGVWDAGMKPAVQARLGKYRSDPW